MENVNITRSTVHAVYRTYMHKGVPYSGTKQIKELIATHYLFNFIIIFSSSTLDKLFNKFIQFASISNNGTLVLIACIISPGPVQKNRGMIEDFCRNEKVKVHTQLGKAITRQEKNIRYIVSTHQYVSRH